MSEVDLWLKELRLGGYSVIRYSDKSVYIDKPSTSLSLLLGVRPVGWEVLVFQGAGHSRTKHFSAFEEMADWVEEKLRIWPDHWSEEGPPGTLPDD